MRTIFTILIFIIFCVVAFILGYRAGQAENITEEVLKIYGEEILSEIEKYLQEEEEKKNKNSTPKI